MTHQHKRTLIAFPSHKTQSLLLASAISLCLGSSAAYSALSYGDEIYLSFDNSSDDFTDGGDTWNRLAFSSTVGTLDSNLQNTDNALTGVGIDLIDRLTAGSGAGDTDGTLWPDAAAADYWFGDNGTHNGGSSGNNLGEFDFTGLDQGLSYTFEIFASRDTSGTRETNYTVTGLNSGSGTLNVAGNQDDSVTIASITPDNSGKITLSFQSGTNNDTSQKYFYINALKITAIPEPSSTALVLGMCSLLVLARRRKW